MRRNLGQDPLGTRPDYLDPEWASTDEQSSTTPRFALGTVEMDKIPRGDLEPMLEQRDIQRGLRANDVVEIVHDLKNPLATIALEMCLLADKLGDTGSLDIRTTVARVQRNVAYLDRLVQDILDSCAFDTGTFSLHRRPTELHALLDQVVERAVPTRDRPRIYLDVPGRLVLSIDDLRIERVIANLVQNALKYSAPETGIVVRMTVGTQLCISVIDTGRGMSEQELGHVFEKYWRTDEAESYEGSGLGLYVSRRIIEAHGGRIGVDSVRNIGSRFYFELPLA